MGLLIFLTIIGFPVLEIYVLIQVGSRIGIINTIFTLVAVGVLGAGLAKSEGRAIQEALGQSLARGEVPTSKMLQRVLVFFGGVLFIIPGFVSDVIALVLILPGSRHLIAHLLRRKLEKQMRSGQQGAFRVFTSGPFGASAGFGTGGGFGRANPEDESFGRDVTPRVIDVTPISKSKVEDDPSDKGH